MMIRNYVWLALVGCSSFLLLLTLGLIVTGSRLRPHAPFRQYLTLSEDFRVAAQSRSWDSRLVFFNTELGPYSGGIIALAEEEIQRAVGFGDTCGLYYRYFKIRGNVTWTLSVSLWYPLVLFAILPAFEAFRSFHSRR